MSPLDAWCLVIGAFLVSMALIGSIVERLPVTPAILYLAAGYAISSAGLHELHPITDAGLLRGLSEIAVAISLFAVGLKLRVPLTAHAWRVPLRLALPALVLTIVLCTGAVQWLYGVPFGMALVLSAILSPTDPVLGADVHVAHPGDRDQVRFGVTAEGGINDAVAMPIVLLGLGLLGRHDLGGWGLHWLLVEVLWFMLGGFAIGWAIGWLIGRLVLYLRHRHSLATGLDEFLGFGVIGLAFGGAGELLASEFLAVFAAGLALRQIERRISVSGGINPAAVSIDDKDAATDPERAAAHMAQTLLAFNTQAEHIAELALVMVLGGLLAGIEAEARSFALAAFLFLVARPLAVGLSLLGTASQRHQRRLIAWFGIRGVGSLYYLAFVLQSGLVGLPADRLASAVLVVIAASIVIHGVTATPLMQLYYRRSRRDPGA
ncbi:MAG TPA: cation:proton antiporter [Azonexus sp.]